MLQFTFGLKYAKTHHTWCLFFFFPASTHKEALTGKKKHDGTSEQTGNTLFQYISPPQTSVDGLFVWAEHI